MNIPDDRESVNARWRKVDEAILFIQSFRWKTGRPVVISHEKGGALKVVRLAMAAPYVRG
jgi:hypothetical protein